MFYVSSRISPAADSLGCDKEGLQSQSFQQVEDLARVGNLSASSPFMVLVTG